MVLVTEERSEVTYVVQLSTREARALQVLIDNTVRLGCGPVSDVFYDLGEALDEFLPPVETYYCKVDEKGVDFRGETLDSIWE